MNTSGEEKVYNVGELYQMHIEELMPDPNQPRKYFDQAALDDLKTSISKHQVLQPILVRKDDSFPDKYVIVSGERRYRAAQELGQLTIPAIITNGNPAEIALVENIIREDLQPLEEAEALKGLKEDCKYTDEMLGLFVRKARSTVTEILSITKLPVHIREQIHSKPILAKRTLIRLAKMIDREKELERAFKIEMKIAEDRLSKSDTPRKARAHKSDAVKNSIASLSKKIEKINSSATWNNEDRNKLVTDLNDLQKKIRTLLNTIKSTSAQESAAGQPDEAPPIVAEAENSHVQE